MIPGTCLLVAASAAACLAPASIACAQRLTAPAESLPAPLTPQFPHVPAPLPWPGSPLHKPDNPWRPPADTDLNIPRLRPTWMLEFIAARQAMPSAPNSRHLCRMDAVRDVLEQSAPSETTAVQSPPSFSDLDAARAWLSEQTVLLAHVGEQTSTVRLQHLQLHRMQCAVPAVTGRLQALSAYILAGKPTFRAQSGPFSGRSSTDKAQASYSYGWFEPFTILTDGVSVQEKRVRRLMEDTCDASEDAQRAIQAKRLEQKECIDKRVGAAMDSPSGLPDYARCYTIVAPAFTGCLREDGAGSACPGDPERMLMPYLMTPGRASSSDWTALQLKLIDETQQGVSVLLPAVTAARDRFAIADHNAQKIWLASVSYLQAGIDQEQALQEAETIRLTQERAALASLAATIAHQKQELAQRVSEQAQAQHTLDMAQTELQAAQSRLSLIQRQAGTALKRAETAFLEDSSRRQDCANAQEECNAAMEAGFERSRSSVDSFKAARAALQDATTARILTSRLEQTVMQEKLNLLQMAMRQAQTQTLLDANNDQHAKRSQSLSRNLAHLASLASDNKRDRLTFDSVRQAVAALDPAPEPACTGS